MLESTYIHCPGVGPRTERKLWHSGASTWSDYLALNGEVKLSKPQRQRLNPLIEESIERLNRRDYAWFARRLPPREHWRAYRWFRNRIAYLDIETTGGYAARNLTVVGVYDGLRTRQFVKGDNLDEFPDSIEGKSLLVTFCGTGFDLPFLRRVFRMEFPQIHIDLCFLLRRLGFTGGLKRIEARFGIERSPGTRGLSGWDAVRLWGEYTQGRESSLQTLLTYNVEDVENLEVLLGAAFPMILDQVRATDSAYPNTRATRSSQW